MICRACNLAFSAALTNSRAGGGREQSAKECIAARLVPDLASRMVRIMNTWMLLIHMRGSCD